MDIFMRTKLNRLFFVSVNLSAAFFIGWSIYAILTQGLGARIYAPFVFPMTPHAYDVIMWGLFFFVMERRFTVLKALTAMFFLEGLTGLLFDVPYFIYLFLIGFPHPLWFIFRVPTQITFLAICIWLLFYKMKVKITPKYFAIFPLAILFLTLNIYWVNAGYHITQSITTGQLYANDPLTLAIEITWNILYLGIMLLFLTVRPPTVKYDAYRAAHQNNVKPGWIEPPVHKIGNCELNQDTHDKASC